MTYFSDILPQLRHAAYLRCYFQLEFLQPVALPQGALLQLRREFVGVLKALKEQGRDDLWNRLTQLFFPPLPVDQLLRAQVKSPPPGVVLSFHCLQAHSFQSGDCVTLMTLFIGDEISAAPDFLTLLRGLGEQGIYCGTGQYKITVIQVETANGDVVDLNIKKDNKLLDYCPVCDFQWWLGNQTPHGEAAILEIYSPLRLQKAGKPVFRPDAAIIVEALVRRVSTLLAYHCHIDIAYEQDELDYLLSTIETGFNKLRWQDWRQLQGDFKQQKIGGVLGRLEIVHSGSIDLFYLLKLGQFFNLGKSAAFGAGQYRLLSL